MCVDVSQESLRSLIDLILQHEGPLLQPETINPVSPTTHASSNREVGAGVPGDVVASELEGLVVLSAVNVLTNQIFQLLRGATPAQVRN